MSDDFQKFNYNQVQTFKGIQAQRLWREIQEVLKAAPLPLKPLQVKMQGWAADYVAWVVSEAKAYDLLTEQGGGVLVLK